MARQLVIPNPQFVIRHVSAEPPGLYIAALSCYNRAC